MSPYPHTECNWNVVTWLHIWGSKFTSRNYFPKSFVPNIKVRISKIRKIKNKILAIEAAPAAIPVKPKIAAMIAIIKKITAHLSIIENF